jgi:hypothetical protein
MRSPWIADCRLALAGKMGYYLENLLPAASAAWISEWGRDTLTPVLSSPPVPPHLPCLAASKQSNREKES